MSKLEPPQASPGPHQLFRQHDCPSPPQALHLDDPEELYALNGAVHMLMKQSF